MRGEARDPRDDRTLVVRLLRGDETAFEEFFAANFPRLFRFALRRLGDEDAAEEVAQAALTRALERIRTWRGEAALFTWLCTICRHTIADRRRRAAARPTLVPVDESPDVRAALEALAADADTPETRLARQELAALVHLTLDALPARYADVLESKYVAGLSMAEIAARTGTSAKAVESLLTRARAAFSEGFAVIAASYEVP